MTATGTRGGRLVALMALLAAAWVGNVHAEGVFTETVDGVKWTYYQDTEGRASIQQSQGYLYGYAGDLVIPGQLGGGPVIGIGAYAFRNCRSLTSVAIPETVSFIGERAFEFCVELQSVEIPGAVAEIGEHAFANSGLESVAIGNGVESIGRYAFQSCARLREAVLPDSVAHIGPRAFENCHSLGRLEFGDGLEEIGTYAFVGCTNLASVAISGNGVSIGGNAFVGCSGLRTVALGDGVEKIGGGAFSSCAALESIRVDDANPVYADVDGVLFCKGGETLLQYPQGRKGPYAIPGTVTAVGGGAFVGSDGLTVLEVPAGMTEIADGALAFCHALERIEVADGNPAYADSDGVLVSADGKMVLCCPAGRRGTYMVPEGVVDIGDGAFRGCTALEEVSLPEGVESIGASAFGQCLALASVELPDSLRTIGFEAFYKCTALRTLDLGGGLREIGRDAFYACTALESVQFGECLETIGNWAFFRCSPLASVGLPDSLRSIGDYAFYLCEALESVDLGQGVRSIGASAFCNDATLLSLSIPDSVESLGESVFEECDGLRRLELPALWEGTSMLDGTGVPDGCEITYRAATPDQTRYAEWLAELDKTVAALPMGADTDTDGASNWDECVAGSDPLDASDRLEARLVEADGRLSVVPSVSAPGRTYRVLGTRELTDASWVDATDTAGDILQSPLRFFRTTAAFAE